MHVERIFTIVLDIFGIFAGRIHFVQWAGALRIFRIEGHDQGVAVHHVHEFSDYETLLRVTDPHLLVLHPELHSETDDRDDALGEPLSIYFSFRFRYSRESAH